MKTVLTWRALACSLFAISLLWQPMLSFGQELPTAPVMPPATRLYAGAATVAPVRLQPRQVADAPISMATILSPGDGQEMAHVRTVLSTAANNTPARPAAQRETNNSVAQALTFTPAFTAFLPMVSYEPGQLYGNVTYKGAPVAGVPVLLRFFDGVSNSTIATVTTDAAGGYTFTNYPALANTQQEYWIRYNNSDANPDRLSLWLTQVITTYAYGNRYRFNTFDIANVGLGSPQPGAVITAPQTFTWTMRTATPSDSYELLIFDQFGVTSNYYASGLLRYTGAKNLTSVPAWINLLTPYGWYVDVHAPDGGSGESFYYSPVRFGKSGIQGRVTLGGANASGISVQLFLQPAAGAPVLKDTKTTASDGIYQFTAAATLLSGQKYYVQYSNNTLDTRLSAWYNNYINAYTAGQRAYGGNFDVANITLGSPNGALSSPYTFTWTPRADVPHDWYSVEVFNAARTLDYAQDAVGNAGSLSLGSIPAGFSAGVSYRWVVRAYGGDGGIGYSYYYMPVTFQG